ncbi:hypothetical protein GGX14DRAFT_384409 [Mycena pura]|uniref:Uncharacterized protein n=1 Tax=Mycena pura TaxID=153505 RepID=A0AAD6YVP7_9AGAR|nr:hypothetical protein GGX14DRAFT_384409 [Mycena pura]
MATAGVSVELRLGSGIVGGVGSHGEGRERASLDDDMVSLGSCSSPERGPEDEMLRVITNTKATLMEVDPPRLSGEGLAFNSGGAALSLDLYCGRRRGAVRAHLCETGLDPDRLDGGCRRGIIQAPEEPLRFREVG